MTDASSQRQPVAYVPVHPRTGPLWSETFPAGSEVHRSKNYERMPLYAVVLAESAPAKPDEAFEPFIRLFDWPLRNLPDTDVIQCRVITPDYETGGIDRAYFGLTVGDFRRLAEVLRRRIPAEIIA